MSKGFGIYAVLSLCILLCILSEEVRAQNFPSSGVESFVKNLGEVSYQSRKKVTDWVTGGLDSFPCESVFLPNTFRALLVEEPRLLLDHVKAFKNERMDHTGFLNNLMAHAGFKSKKDKSYRMQVLRELTSQVEGDQVVLDNMMALANRMKAYGLIDIEDIKKVFNSSRIPNATFYYSTREQRLLGKIVTSEAKKLAVDQLISFQSHLNPHQLESLKKHLYVSVLDEQNIQALQRSGLQLGSSEAEINTFYNFLNFLEIHLRRSGDKRLSGIKRVLGYDPHRALDKDLERIVDIFDEETYFRDWPRFFRKNFSTVRQFKKLHFKVENRNQIIEEILDMSGIKSPYYRKNYTRILIDSRLDVADFNKAIENGFTLYEEKFSLELFEKWILYIDGLPEYRYTKALAQFNQLAESNFYEWTIARYFSRIWALPQVADGVYLGNFSRSLYRNFIYAKEVFSPMGVFKINRAREAAHLERAILLKTLEEKAIARGVDPSVFNPVEENLAGAYKYSKRQAQYLKELFLLKAQDAPLPPKLQKILDVKLDGATKARILARAKEESKIYKSLLRSCSTSNAIRANKAAKTFTRLKTGLTFFSTLPFYYANRYFYALDNPDIAPDPYLHEKGFYELIVGTISRYVVSRITVSTNHGLLARYAGTYAYNAFQASISMAAFEKLFGSEDYMGWIYSLFREGKTDESKSEVIAEYKRIVASPRFKQEIQKLVTYLQKHQEDNSIKNFIGKYINAFPSDKMPDDYRVTLEDLESENARDVLLELIAEKIYLEKYGTTGIINSGYQGLDRYIYYRTKGTVHNWKSLIFNLGIYELLCRMPIANSGVATFLTGLGIVITDNMVMEYFSLYFRVLTTGQ